MTSSINLLTIKAFEYAEEYVNEQFMGYVKALAHLHFNESDALYLIEAFREQAKWYVVGKEGNLAGMDFDLNVTTTGIEMKHADKSLLDVSIEFKHVDEMLFGVGIENKEQAKKKTRRGGKKHKK